VGADRRHRPITVMLVEDHALVRAAMRQAIAGPDIHVVAEASTPDDAVETALECRPDVLLLDIDLPGITGLQLLRELAPRLPETKIVMLTVSSARRDVLEAVRSGAAGYLTKDLSPEALARSIMAAVDGDLAMPRRMAAEVLAELVRDRRSRPSTNGGGLSALTARETEILRMISDGLTDRETANALRLSIRTVETHVSNLLHKLGARNRADAARIYRDET
jgi:two-component system nitrate/nitrite response regulator NarL